MEFFIKGIKIQIKNLDYLQEEGLILVKDGINQVQLIIEAKQPGYSLRLKAGDPVEMNGAHRGSNIYILNLGIVLKAPAMQSLHFPGWNIALIGETISMAPIDEIDIPSGTSYQVDGQITVGAGLASKGSIGFKIYNISPIESYVHFGGNMKALLKDPAGNADGDLHNLAELDPVGGPLRVAVSRPGIDVANSFSFSFKTKQDVLMANSLTYFTLSFVYSTLDENSNGALCSRSDISHSVLSETSGSWKIEPQLDGLLEGQNSGDPGWKLIPSHRMVSPVIPITFQLANLFTHLDPGLTLLYFHYYKISNIDDGFLSLPIQKVSDLYIKEFSALPAVVFGPGSRILPHWDVCGTPVSMTLTPAGMENETLTPITQTTTWTLTVQGVPASNRDTRQLTVEVREPLQILQFSANPPTASRYPVSVELSWEVRGEDRITLNGEPQESTSKQVIMTSPEQRFVLIASYGNQQVSESISVLPLHSENLKFKLFRRDSFERYEVGVSSLGQINFVSYLPLEPKILYSYSPFDTNTPDLIPIPILDGANGYLCTVMADGSVVTFLSRDGLKCLVVWPQGNFDQAYTILIGRELDNIIASPSGTLIIGIQAADFYYRKSVLVVVDVLSRKQITLQWIYPLTILWPISIYITPDLQHIYCFNSWYGTYRFNFNPLTCQYSQVIHIPEIRPTGFTYWRSRKALLFISFYNKTLTVHYVDGTRADQNYHVPQLLDLGNYEIGPITMLDDQHVIIGIGSQLGLFVITDDSFTYIRTIDIEGGYGDMVLRLSNVGNRLLVTHDNQLSVVVPHFHNS